MKLKLDENLGERGAEIFQAAGHDVATVASQKMTSASDRDLIQACHAEARCLVTLDLDFSNPFLFPPHEYSGIAVIRLPSKPTDEDLWSCCGTLIAGLQPLKSLGSSGWSSRVVCESIGPTGLMTIKLATAAAVP